MFNELEVGKLFVGGKFKGRECIKFDVDDFGCNLILSFKSPSDKEIESIRNGKIKMGYYTEGEAIFMLFKVGDMGWMDAPYSVHLSKNLTEIKDITEGKGIALMIYLIDANTGILKVLRCVGMPTNFSRKIKNEIEKQTTIPFESYYDKVNEVYAKYPTKKLVEYANLICSV